MSTPFQQIRLDSIAASPDQRVANHLKPITVAERPQPGPNELLVRVLMSPIHPCDLLCAAGLVPRKKGARDGRDNTQFTPGLEAVGVIEEVGVTLGHAFDAGDRVFVCCWAPWGTWDEANGVWSEYILVKKDNVIAVPDGISDSTAAMFLVVPVTAYVMMIEELGLKEGDWLIQNAAGSAVGRWVIALAQDLGINTINLVRRQEQVEELRKETGAEHIMWCPEDGSLNEQLISDIHKVTGDGLVKGSFDAVGDGFFASLVLEVMSRYGTVVVYGILGNTNMTIDFNACCRVALESLKITGFSLQNWWLPDTDDTTKARVYDAVWKHIQSNPKLNPQVESIYPFSEIGAAIRSSLQHKTGKVLICPQVHKANEP